MKILFLTSRMPYPPYRGDKLKIFNLIKQLAAKKHEITLISFIASKDELKYIDPLRQYCSKVKTVYIPAWRSLLNCIAVIFRGKPYQVAYYRSRPMSRLVEDEIATDRFEAIHVHLIRMAQYAEKRFEGVPAVLDLTDAGSLYLQRFHDTTKNPIKKIFLREELGRIKKYERVLEHFDRCLVCSHVDRDVLLRHAPKARIDLLYNGVDLEYFTAAGGGRRPPDPHRIICTGNMKYFPNSDSVIYFTKEIFPLIKKQLPQAKLYIVGNDPPRKVRRLGRSDVIVTGFVMDIKEYYLQSTVAVAPIRFGAGTLNKILEPMALGVPVVASPIGVEGLPVTNDRDILIAEDPEGFADAVIRVMKDIDLQKKLSENSSLLVRKLYDWKNIATQLESYYESCRRDTRKI